MTLKACLMFKCLWRMKMPALAGLLLFAAFRYNYWALAIFAIAIFYRKLLDAPFKTRLIVTFAFATGFFIPHLWWVSVLGFDALLLLAALCIASFMLIASFPIASGSFACKLEFASVWALIELIRAHYPWGGFGWGLLGYSQTSGPLVQYARIGNFALVAFVVALIATLIADFRPLHNFRQHFLALTLLVFGFCFPTSAEVGELKVGVVQGGVVSAAVPEFARASQVLVNHLQQTQEHVDELQRADVVVWPENSVNLQSDPVGVTGQVQAVVNLIGKPFLIGAVRDGVDGHPENVVTLWLPRSGPQTSYIKNHLVPFGEYIPMRNLLARHVGRLDQIPSDFAHGQGGGVMEVAGTKVGVAICFEVADQDHLTDLVHEDAQLFFAASNNATYLRTQQPAQQFEISRFSAIAHQRTMVVATTSGVSGLVSPNGDVSNQIVETGGKVFVAKISLFDGRTFTDKHPLFQYLFIGALVPLFVIRKVRIRSAHSQEDRSSE